ncbi:hypothetical protein ACF9IK_00960 [Kitasatospora hibisci]|uniref:hypothetical protein n=1 Tax=Kitasatospora hibisci TaxID=3369522 RepID=UPI0037547FB3
MEEDSDGAGRLVGGAVLGMLNGLPELAVPEGEFAAGGGDPGVKTRVVGAVGAQQGGAGLGFGLGAVAEVAGHPGHQREQIAGRCEELAALLGPLVTVQEVPDLGEQVLRLPEDEQRVLGHQVGAGEVPGVGGELFQGDGAAVGELGPPGPVSGFLCGGLDQVGTGGRGGRHRYEGRRSHDCGHGGVRLVAQQAKVGLWKGAAVLQVEEVVQGGAVEVGEDGEHGQGDPAPGRVGPLLPLADERGVGGRSAGAAGGVETVGGFLQRSAVRVPPGLTGAETEACAHLGGDRRRRCADGEQFGSQGVTVGFGAGLGARRHEGLPSGVRSGLTTSR